jgi:hypothetical protein
VLRKLFWAESTASIPSVQTLLYAIPTSPSSSSAGTSGGPSSTGLSVGDRAAIASTVLAGVGIITGILMIVFGKDIQCVVDEQSPPPNTQSLIFTWILSAWYKLSSLKNMISYQIHLMMRPRLKQGYCRIEWTCVSLSLCQMPLNNGVSVVFKLQFSNYQKH